MGVGEGGNSARRWGDKIAAVDRRAGEQSGREMQAGVKCGCDARVIARTEQRYFSVQ